MCFLFIADFAYSIDIGSFSDLYNNWTTAPDNSTFIFLNSFTLETLPIQNPNWTAATFVGNGFTLDGANIYAGFNLNGKTLTFNSKISFKYTYRSAMVFKKLTCYIHRRRSLFHK